MPLGLIQVLSGTVGALGFSILFNIRGQRLLVSAIGGFLSWTAYLLFEYLTGSEVLSYFIVAVLITAYAEWMARVVKTPTTTFIMAALVPLIPGASLYYTMRSALLGDFEIFGSRAVYTLELAAALALGVIVASALSKAIFSAVKRIKVKSRQYAGFLLCKNEIHQRWVKSRSR